MCDYSLQHVASRPAKVGDELVSTKFHNSITRGFAAGDDPNVAVCLLPGTELAFERRGRLLWSRPDRSRAGELSDTEEPLGSPRALLTLLRCGRPEFLPGRGGYLRI